MFRFLRASFFLHFVGAERFLFCFPKKRKKEREKEGALLPLPLVIKHTKKTMKAFSKRDGEE